MSRKQAAGSRAQPAAVWPIRGWWWYIIVPIVLLVLVSIMAPPLFKDTPAMASPSRGVSYPLYARTDIRIKDAYAYAIDNPRDMQYIPCFCGCGAHAGHTSIHDCFIKRQHVGGGAVAFDDHGANCAMCVNIMLDSKARLQRGEPLAQVKQYVVSEYGGTGVSTNTPPIPGL